MSAHAVAGLVEHAEAQAYVDMFRAAPADVGVHAYEFDAATVLLAPKVDVPLFNRAIGLGLPSAVSEQAVESLVAIFTEAGVKNFALQISPVALTADLESWLAAERLAVRDRWSKVFRSHEPERTPQTDLRIEAVEDDQAATFGVVACEGFRMPAFLAPWLSATVGRPGWRHYLAWDRETPVATGALFMNDGVGWLGIAATLEAYRRRGAQSALMAARLRHGLGMGCEWFVTETGEDTRERPNPSYHNMMRAGFSLAYHRPNFMRPRT